MAVHLSLSQALVPKGLTPDVPKERSALRPLNPPHVLCRIQDRAPQGRLVPSLTGDTVTSLEIAPKGAAGLEPGFEQRLRWAIGSESVASFSKRVGIQRTYLYAVLRGEKTPSLAILCSISAQSGMSTDWLLSGRGMPSRKLEARTLIVPCFDITPEGMLVASGEHDVVNAKKARGMNPEYAARVEASDDGLAPRIVPGDGLLIEVPAPELVDGGVYLVQSGRSILIRRAAVLADGRWAMLQENSTQRAQPKVGADLGELNVLARVWSILERAL